MRTVTELISENLPYLVTTLSVALSLGASAHAVMYKRKSRAAASWVGLIWLSPFLGAALYLLLGVNRTRQVARPKDLVTADARPARSVSDSIEFAIDRVARTERVVGTKIEPLENGDAAYPSMKAAIGEATRRVHLCTYIFDRDRAGLAFADALGAAAARGVEVCVLVDDLGARYSLPSIVSELRRRGIKVGRYHRSYWPWHLRYANLRNHRKSLIVDDKIGFTGGMNIRAGHVLGWQPRDAIRDLHFRIEGPLVGQLDEVFRGDWREATGEVLPVGAPSRESLGASVGRCLADGPDDPANSIRWTLMAALACSHERVRVVTPYFVPDAGLIAALATAALRGVRVEIILPEVNNLRIVQWASEATLWQVLERGCRVFKTAGPFDHSKLMVVDDDWCLFGSVNWDARSLRLNFELNVECEDRDLVEKLHATLDRKLEASREVTLADVDSRSHGVRLRDGTARLLSPYL